MYLTIPTMEILLKDLMDQGGNTKFSKNRI